MTGVLKQTREEKVQWLLQHRAMWETADLAGAVHQEIVLAMKHDGLIAATTWYHDVNLVSLVNEARSRLVIDYEI